MNLVTKIASELSLQEYQVNNVVKLIFEDECTIPFVARYRKEMTGSIDEVLLRSIRDRYEYLTNLEKSKEKYLKVVEAHCQGKPELLAKFPELKEKFIACETKQELEDLYLPFKPKRRTRAQIAKEKGLEPLANRILTECCTITDLNEIAAQYITKDDPKIDPSLRIHDADSALNGASDIIAEMVSETAEHRAMVRGISHETGFLMVQRAEVPGEAEQSDEETNKATTSKDGKKRNSHSKYENYFDFKEPVNAATGYRVMAIRRGEAEKELRVKIEVDKDRIHHELKEAIIKDPDTTQVVRSWLEGVIEDAYRRLLAPSIETQIRVELKNKAEGEAIKVFSSNLENLLLLPPIPGKIVLGVDPGIRTGSKLAVVSDTGKYLTSTTVYPEFNNENSLKTKKAREEIATLLKKYGVEYIAIGNGTGSKEINRIVAQTIKEQRLKNIKRVVVNEAGASVYSTDAIAREEFPTLDATIRSAISIARRLQDPLAELVKIDPRSIGVGQYQHDVNVNKLSQSLSDIVESCVNRVGVNVNTASYSLLSYVSGINKTIAKNIVVKRDRDGKYLSREKLLDVASFGPKTFQQATGFLRIPESKNPLDNTAVHPESYPIVEQIARDLSVTTTQIIGSKETIDRVPLEKYVNEQVGMPTLVDITGELLKPGRDPREDGARLCFSDDIMEMEDLRIGMVIPGTVTNVTNFGAFVDIGVHQDGLVHISEMTDDKFVDDPTKEVTVGQVLNVRVIDVDLKRRRISLSCRKKQEGEESRQPERSSASMRPRGGGRERNGPGRARPRHHGQNPRSSEGGEGSHRERRNRPNRPHRGRSDRERDKGPKYTVEDLMAKFNKR